MPGNLYRRGPYSNHAIEPVNKKPRKKSGVPSIVSEESKTTANQSPSNATDKNSGQFGIVVRNTTVNNSDSPSNVASSTTPDDLVPDPAPSSSVIGKHTPLVVKTASGTVELYLPNAVLPIVQYRDAEPEEAVHVECRDFRKRGKVIHLENKPFLTIGKYTCFVNGLPCLGLFNPNQERTFDPTGKIKCRPYVVIHKNSQKFIHPLDIWAIKYGEMPSRKTHGNCVAQAWCLFCQTESASHEPCGNSACPSLSGKLLTGTCLDCGLGAFLHDAKVKKLNMQPCCQNSNCPSIANSSRYKVAELPFCPFLDRQPVVTPFPKTGEIPRCPPNPSTYCGYEGYDSDKY